MSADNLSSIRTQHLKVWCVYFVGVFFFGLCPVFAAADGRRAVPESALNSSVQMSYDFDGALLYTDKLSKVGSKSAMITASEPSLVDDTAGSTSASYRSAGLRHMKMGIEWLTPRRIRAFVLLRPDAVHGGGGTVRKEVDTRSGIRLAPANDIQLLDLYELAMLREGVAFAVGVRERILFDHKAYQDVLEFGLESRDPRKMFGAYIDLPKLASLGDDRTLFLHFAALTESDDRHTERSVNEHTGDEGPASRTPYWGGSVSTYIEFSNDASAGIGATVVESKVPDGKLTRTFYDLGLVRSLWLSTQELRFGMDVRQNKETYKLASAELAETSGTSASVTASAEVLPGRMVLIGLRAGSVNRQATDDTSKSLPARGIQGEVGLRAWLGDGLEATSLVTREWCRGQMEAEGQAGCFGTVGSRSTTISRFALQVAYRTGGSL